MPNQRHPIKQPAVPPLMLEWPEFYKKFRTIVADPPWDINQKGKRGAAAHYDLMNLDSIKKMPVGDLAQDNAHLWLWVPNGLAQEGLDVMKAWGFTYRNLLTNKAASSRISNIACAFRTLESAGVKIVEEKEKADNLNFAHIPWQFPLRLSIKELASFLLLPFGIEELPGTLGLHPRMMHPPEWYENPRTQNQDRTFAESLNPSNVQKLSISPEASLEHTIILGPTGSGKSTAMLNLILADINAGRSVLVLDPKADLVTNILERIPANRADDVVVINPADDNPVGFNPLTLTKGSVWITTHSSAYMTNTTTPSASWSTLANTLTKQLSICKATTSR